MCISISLPTVLKKYYICCRKKSYLSIRFTSTIIPRWCGLLLSFIYKNEFKMDYLYNNILRHKNLVSKVLWTLSIYFYALQNGSFIPRSCVEAWGGYLIPVSCLSCKPEGTVPPSCEPSADCRRQRPASTWLHKCSLLILAWLPLHQVVPKQGEGHSFRKMLLSPSILSSLILTKSLCPSTQPCFYYRMLFDFCRLSLKHQLCVRLHFLWNMLT